MAGNSNVRSRPGRKRARPGAEQSPAAVEDAPQAALSTEDRERWEMIAAAAYFRAEKRGFAPGNEIDDWLAAEHEIANRLSGHSEPLLERLRRERDELRVQIHLAKLDLRKEWDELEHKWELVRARPRSAHREARRAGKEVGLVVLGDIREGYRRIRAALQVTR